MTIVLLLVPLTPLCFSTVRIPLVVNKVARRVMRLARLIYSQPEYLHTKMCQNRNSGDRKRLLTASARRQMVPFRLPPFDDPCFTVSAAWWQCRRPTSGPYQSLSPGTHIGQIAHAHLGCDCVFRSSSYHQTTRPEGKRWNHAHREKSRVLAREKQDRKRVW